VCVCVRLVGFHFPSSLCLSDGFPVKISNLAITSHFIHGWRGSPSEQADLYMAKNFLASDDGCHACATSDVARDVSVEA
jgi:hypothetical protein